MTTAQTHYAPTRALTQLSRVITTGALLTTLTVLSGCYGDSPERAILDTDVVEANPDVIRPDNPWNLTDAGLKDSWIPDATEGPETSPEEGAIDTPPSCGDPALKETAATILGANCAGCHNPANAVTPTLLDILDTDGLLENQKIIPGDPDASSLIKRINLPIDNLKVMPPAGHEKLNDDERALLADWIGCMEPPQNTAKESIDSYQMYTWIEAQLAAHPLPDQSKKRYISLVHLYNAGTDDAELQMYRDGIVKLLNSLSWRTTPYIPVFVEDSQGLVLEIDLDQLEWLEPPLPVGLEDVNIWERIEARYPYAIFDNGDENAEWVFGRTGTRKTPVIHGDWFAATASVPPLYHEILGIPDTLPQLEEIMGIDIQQNVSDVEVMRAGVSFSNVSVNNRVVERHVLGFNESGGIIPAYDGAFWISYDFAGEKGLQNIIQHPTDFVHDGNEMIFNLPNGFQAYMITTADGQRLDKAPSGIVSDNFPDATSNIGPEVTNGLSCISCHYSGIQPAEDIVRGIVAGYETSQQYPGEVKADVQDLYPPHDAFDQKQEWDTDTFANALADASIPEALDRYEEPTSQLAYEHLEPMDLTEVAAAVGLTVDEFQAHEGLPRLTKARAQIGNLANNQGKLVKRAIFDESFRDITCFLDRGQPVTDEVDGDGLPKSGCTVARLCNKNSGLDGIVRLTLDGVELEALPGKCSPCRNLPVGDNLVAEVVVETVTDQVNDKGQVVKVVEKIFLPPTVLSLEDSDEILLDVTAIIEGEQIVDQEVVAFPIPSTATCDDINSFEDL